MKGVWDLIETVPVVHKSNFCLNHTISLVVNLIDKLVHSLLFLFCTKYRNKHHIFQIAIAHTTVTIASENRRQTWSNKLQINCLTHFDLAIFFLSFQLLRNPLLKR